VKRGLLRHRKLHSKAIFGITDDKKHDSYAAQWFMKASLNLLKCAYVDTGIERFFAIHVHSDNAGSHFKSSKTMFFLTTLLALCASWPVAATAGAVGMSIRAFWEFGPPGHGKGVWDGLGALIKRAVKQDIIDDVALTASKRITSAKEVAEHVRARFSTDEWKASHAAMTINEIVVVHGSTEEIHSSRPQPDYEWRKPKSNCALPHVVAAHGSATDALRSHHAPLASCSTLAAHLHVPPAFASTSASTPVVEGMQRWRG
jgi:hypothetical protein